MSVNILLNYYNFDGDWARPHLEKYLKNLPHVLILPLAFREKEVWDNETWLKLYGKGGEKYPNILRPFEEYGYREGDIDWLDPFENRNFQEQIAQADMLFFTGGMPEKAIARLRSLGLENMVKNFDGIVAGASAGAMLQLDRYHITPDDDYDAFEMCRGLGLVGGLDLEVHYTATDLQDRCAMQAHLLHKLPVYKMQHEGGVLIDNGKVTPLGKVEILGR